MLARLRHTEDGFSLMELMTAMVIGSVVLTALMTIFVNSLNTTTTVNDRVDGAQRGRLVVDRITSLLDSQVCLEKSDATTGTYSLVAPVQPTVSDGNTITFYGDIDPSNSRINPKTGKVFGTGPDKYTITYDPTAKTLTQVYTPGVGDQSSSAFTFDTTQTTTTLLAKNILPARAGGVPTGAQLPIFQYYAFTGTGAITGPLATPLSVTDAPTVVRVHVQFQAVPTRTGAEDKRSASLSGQGNVLTSNPDSTSVC